MADLVRFGVSIPDDLLEKFDELISHKGYTNRSEAIRDLIRDRLVDNEWSEPQGDVVSTCYRGLQSRTERPCPEAY